MISPVDAPIEKVIGRSSATPMACGKSRKTSDDNTDGGSCHNSQNVDWSQRALKAAAH
ncbi:MAG: hypothetical protein ACLSE4_05755 [Clostridium sp.]